MPTSRGAASPPKKVSFRWAAGEGGMLDGGSGAPQPLALCPPHQGTQPGQHLPSHGQDGGGGDGGESLGRPVPPREWGGETCANRIETL